MRGCDCNPVLRMMPAQPGLGPLVIIIPNERRHLGTV